MEGMPPESPACPRVLVVDDERRLTDLLRLELDVEGYVVDVADDGIRADPKQNGAGTDLIILDWNLPDFSGIDICQRMRAGGIHTPILACSPAMTMCMTGSRRWMRVSMTTW